jgi:CDP-glucose 4,6-dehydratase
MSERYARLRGRTVLLTGATGFLGGAACRELLGHGIDVAALVRDRVVDLPVAGSGSTAQLHVIHGRIEDDFRIYSALAVHEVAAVVHLASCDPNQSTRGTATVLEAVLRYDPRVPVVVARPANAPPVGGSPVVLGVARFGEVFGGGDRNTFRLVPATILASLSGDRAPAPPTGTARDFVFVRDAARACVTLAESLVGGSPGRVEDVSFRSGWSLTDPQMSEAIRTVFEGGAPPCDRVAPPPNPLDWSPAATLGNALAATIDWYRVFLRSRFFGTKPDASTRRAAA